MKILIVDDDANSRTYLERALKSQGYSVELAANGVAALEQAGKSPPDLIVSDIMMPEMDGFELCRRVKSDEHLLAIPFVFYTATYIEPRDEKLAMALGASRFLVKPMELDDLFAAIKSVIDEHRRKTLDVPKQPLAETTDLDRMQLEVLARKLDKKVRELEEEREALLHARHAAEAANRAKSQFLANMSHELRTPMAGVLGMLEITLGGSLEEKQREFIATAHKSAGSLVRILNDILEMTKIEAGMLSIEEESFDLGECVRSVIDIFGSEARHKGLDLTLSMTDDVPERVVGDCLRLRQVLTSLVGNAVKFTERGKVELRVAKDIASYGKRGFTFTVADTGIGIPEDKKHLVFHAFSQVDGSHTRKYGGTGLGLAISREIVERMGGTITFDCEEGVGCNFIFTVPLGETGATPYAKIADQDGEK